MNEDQAKAYVSSLGVSRGTVERLDQFVQLLRSANASQNLIASSTLHDVWARHIADSAQLVPLGDAAKGAWIDLGSGPGFPGLIVAAIAQRAVTLVEERAKRTAFLRSAVEQIGLDQQVDVCQGRAERVPACSAAVISARAFAPLPRLFAIASHLAGRDTLWLLPKGRHAAQEVEDARLTWRGDMRLVPSVTSPDAAIVVATDIRPR